LASLGAHCPASSVALEAVVDSSVPSGREAPIVAASMRRRVRLRLRQLAGQAGGVRNANAGTVFHWRGETLSV
jgi:hypothetical protein